MITKEVYEEQVALSNRWKEMYYEKKNENERLKEQNNDLKKIYKNTYNRLFDNGNDELARYFQAQIDDCPTFYVEPIIDYYKEWKDYKSRCEKAVEKSQELKDSIDKSNFDGMTKTILILGINQIQNILQNGSENQ